MISRVYDAVSRKIGYKQQQTGSALNKANWLKYVKGEEWRQEKNSLLRFIQLKLLAPSSHSAAILAHLISIQAAVYSYSHICLPGWDFWLEVTRLTLPRISEKQETPCCELQPAITKGDRLCWIYHIGQLNTHTIRAIILKWNWDQVQTSRW